MDSWLLLLLLRLPLPREPSGASSAPTSRHLQGRRPKPASIPQGQQRRQPEGTHSEASTAAVHDSGTRPCASGEDGTFESHGALRCALWRGVLHTKTLSAVANRGW
jgi:hypothetical protein